MTSNNIILLVEDNPDDADLTRRAFDKSNILNTLVVVGDGAQALDYMFATGAWAGRGQEEDPTIVLLDLKLPKINGLEVLRSLRADPRTKITPVIILTSSVEEEDVIRGYNLGCNSYIHKPVDFLKFTEAVRQLSLYWLVLNQPPQRSRGNR
jgi:DNA-binding response OmpR family regulator